MICGALIGLAVVAAAATAVFGRELWRGLRGVRNAALDREEEWARQECHTDRTERMFHGLNEVNVTDSGGSTNRAEALRRLAAAGRFRVVREYGRMVVGYWPENDPEHDAIQDGRVCIARHAPDGEYIVTVFAGDKLRARKRGGVWFITDGSEWEHPFEYPNRRIVDVESVDGLPSVKEVAL